MAVTLVILALAITKGANAATNFFFGLYDHLDFSPVTESLSGCSSGSNPISHSGDSYSTTSTDFTSTLPSIANPIGNPAWPGFTSDGGYNWINHLVGTYNTSETLCWNFAYGGATTNSTLVHPYSTKVPDFSAQVDLFEQYIGSKPAIAPWTATDSMFGVWLGVNDIGNSYTNTTADETVLISKIMVTYSGQLERLYGYGARNFILLNVPPLQRTPQEVALPTSITANEAPSISVFNTQLANVISNFTSAHSDAVVASVDTQAPFNTALDDPNAYGAPDATCYNANGVSCLWWNNYHPGQAIQKLVAQAAVTAWIKTNETAFFFPVSGTGISTSTTTSSGTTTLPTGSSSGTLAKWSQCAGIGWARSGTCVSGTTCTFSNAWYSQCL